MADNKSNNESQAVINYGKNFEYLLQSEGWKQVDALLAEFEKESLDDLLSYGGSDDRLLRVKQIGHRAVKRTREALMAHINNAIVDAHEHIRQLNGGDYSNE